MDYTYATFDNAKKNCKLGATSWYYCVADDSRCQEIPAIAPGEHYMEVFTVYSASPLKFYPNMKTEIFRRYNLKQKLQNL
jgi:hypothetical protein